MTSTLLGILLAAAGLAWKCLTAAKATPPLATGNLLAKGAPPAPTNSQAEAFAAWLVLRDVMRESGATPEEIEAAAGAVAMRIMLTPKEAPDEA